MERTISKRNNKMRFTKYKPIIAINQKNYYTDYLKRENQLLVNRNETQPMDESKVVVIAPGSRTVQIGYADDPEPREFPMVVSRKVETQTRSDQFRNPRFDEVYPRIINDFKERMRFYKREIDPTAQEQVVEFNSEQGAKTIESSETFVTEPPLVICDDRVAPEFYEMSWPIQNGTFNEQDYDSIQQIFGDLGLIFDHVTEQLGRKRRVRDGEDLSPEDLKKRPLVDWSDHAAVLVIPDLYEQFVVNSLVEVLLQTTTFGKVAIIQESVAATYGAGVSSACVVSVGPQSTQIACIDEGMSVLDSRIHLSYGGEDVTKLLLRTLEHGKFPLNLDLASIVDRKTAEALKKKICTAAVEKKKTEAEKKAEAEKQAEVENQAQVEESAEGEEQAQIEEQAQVEEQAKVEEISVKQDSVSYHAPEHSVSYDFKYYEQAITPILGLFYPEAFDPPSEKHKARGRLVPKPENVYDGKYDDPISDAQINIYMNTLSVFGESYKDKFAPVEEERETPALGATNGANGANGASSASDGTANGANGADKGDKGADKEKEAAPAVDLKQVISTINVADTAHVPLDHAIVESAMQAAAKQQASLSQFLSSILVIGDGADFPQFGELLIDRVMMWAKKLEKDAKVIELPKDTLCTNVAWKGAAIYSKLKVVDEMWIERADWAILGSRIMQYKSILSW